MTLIIIIAITTLISWYGFEHRDFFDKFLYRPYDIKNKNEVWRFVTSAFLHSDWMHLIFNMISLYFFAPIVESEIGAFGLILLYLTGAVVSLIPNYFKNKRFCKYEAIGASGAVSAVVFASIMLAPTAKLMIIFLPIPMAAWFFGVLFLGISFYMYKRDTDNVGHDVHIFGGIWGLIFIILFYVYQAVNCLM